MEDSLSVGPFERFVFPLVRRATPALVASDIVSVQPMTGPVGGLPFYLNQYAVPLRVGDTVRSTGAWKVRVSGTIIVIEERHGRDSYSKVVHAIVETLTGERVVLPLSYLVKVSLLEALAETTEVDLP